MVAAFVKAYYIGPVPGSPNLKPSYVAAILKRGWETIGEEWQQRLRPKHFTEEGAAEYGYASRSTKYSSKKLIRKGHTLPLVYSGELQQKSEAYNLVATSEGVRVKLYWANKANFRNPKSKIDMAKELRTVSDQEIRSQADLLGRRVRSQLLDVRSVYQKSLTGTSVVGFFHGD